MSQPILGVATALVASSVALIGSVSWAAGPAEATSQEIEFIRNQHLAKAARSGQWTFHLVGGLAKQLYWTEILPLAGTQQTALSDLNALMNRARVRSWRFDAAVPADSLREYRAYIDRNNARRMDAIFHAERMASLGVLTEPQAALVLRQHLLDESWRAILERNVQDLLGITADQIQRIHDAGSQLRSNLGDLHRLSLSHEEFQARNNVVLAEYSAALKNVLTPSQLKQWHVFIAEQPLPAKLPELPLLTEAQAAEIRVVDLSPRWRALLERSSALELSKEQRNLLKDLERVIQQGWFWIGVRNRSDREHASRIRAEYLSQAVSFAIDGILTEQQARQFQESA